jgi:Fe-S cluster assembly protein SufD
LQSRGIPEAAAKAMLVSAFVSESFDSVENEVIRDALSDLANKVLSR